MKYIEITDYYGQKQRVRVTNRIYNAWRGMDRKEDRIQNREEYHRANIDLEDSPDFGGEVIVNDRLNEMIQEEDRRRLHAAIESLSPTQRRRVYMFMKHMDYGEVAKREKVSKTAVYKNLQQSFRKLRKLLEE